MRVPEPSDPRLSPFVMLRQYMPLVEGDAEAKSERQAMHRLDLAERVRK